MDERRLMTRLRNCWEFRRRGAAMPPIEALDDAAIEDLWPQCFVVGVHDRERGLLKYERMGEQVVAAFGADLTGRYVRYGGAKEGFPAELVLGELHKVCRELRPTEAVGQFADAGGAAVRWRACFLPCGNAKGGLTHIIVGLSFKRWYTPR